MLMAFLLIAVMLFGQEPVRKDSPETRIYTCATCSIESMKAPFALGVEFQVYPTGLIPGIRAEIPFKPKKIFPAFRHGITARFGFQAINHKGFGVQDLEKGTGFGGSLGYKISQYGFILEGRCDLWINTLDWQTQTSGGQLSGTSTITVVQPTLSLGSKFFLGPGSSWSITPSISAGFEVNVATTGAETGQGLILLGGISLMRDF